MSDDTRTEKCALCWNGPDHFLHNPERPEQYGSESETRRGLYHRFAASTIAPIPAPAKGEVQRCDYGVEGEERACGFCRAAIAQHCTTRGGGLCGDDSCRLIHGHSVEPPHGIPATPHGYRIVCNVDDVEGGAPPRCAGIRTVNVNVIGPDYVGVEQQTVECDRPAVVWVGLVDDAQPSCAECVYTFVRDDGPTVIVPIGDQMVPLITDCLRHRCVKHVGVGPLNSLASGAECGVCIREDVQQPDDVPLTAGSSGRMALLRGDDLSAVCDYVSRWRMFYWRTFYSDDIAAVVSLLRELQEYRDADRPGSGEGRAALLTGGTRDGNLDEVLRYLASRRRLDPEEHSAVMALIGELKVRRADDSLASSPLPSPKGMEETGEYDAFMRWWDSDGREQWENEATTRHIARAGWDAARNRGLASSPSPAEPQECGVPYPEDGSDLDGASFTVCKNARPCENHDTETPVERARRALVEIEERLLRVRSRMIGEGYTQAAGIELNAIGDDLRAVIRVAARTKE